MKTPGITCGKSGACRSTSIPSKTSWKIAEDRARLARVFERGLDHVVGYALPLRREYYTDGTQRLGERRVVLPAGANVFDPRRFADGLPPAARFDSVGAASRNIRSHRRAGPDGGARRHCPTAPRWPGGSAICRSIRRVSTRARDSWSRFWKWRPARRAVAPANPGARFASGAGRIGAVDHSHGAVRGNARRHLARVHAAAALPRRLSRAWSRRSRIRPPTWGCPCSSKAMPRRTIRASTRSKSRPTPA